MLIIAIFFTIPISILITFMVYACYKKMKLFGILWLITMLGALTSFGSSIYFYMQISSQAKPGHALEAINNYPLSSLLCDLVFFVLFLIVEAVRRHFYKNFGVNTKDKK